jgi:hypothetical protein
MTSYLSILLFPQGSHGYGLWLMPSKFVGFTLLMWAARNKILKDWRNFSAKRSREKALERAKMEKT